LDSVLQPIIRLNLISGEHMKKAVCIAALAAASVATLGATLTTGCTPLVVAGAVAGGALVASDRRSVGIQLEDEAIERRVNRALAERFERGTINISVNSYDRKVLLTGETLNEQQRADAEKLAAAAENVRAVVNEIEVGILSTVGSRSNDTAVTAKVRGMLLNERNLPSAAIRVVTERGAVYLMGRVTEREGELAGVVASRTVGVQKVTKLFDYISDQQAAELAPPSAPAQPPQQRP
jgi:osmotically-inducible protein OsmY